MANFVLKIPKFCYRGNNDRSLVTFNDTFKLRDLENPLLDERSLAITPIKKPNYNS